MKIPNRETPRKLEQSNRKVKSLVIYFYALGGSGPLILDALLQNIIAARKEDGYPSIDIVGTIIDLDIASDSKENAKRLCTSLETLLRSLSNQQDTSGILGCLHNIRFNELILSQNEYQKTAKEFVLSQVPKMDQPSVSSAFDLIIPASSGNNEMGNGGQGDPVVGYIASVSHQKEIFALLDRNLEQIRNDPSRDYVNVVANSFSGSSGYNIFPIMMQYFAKHPELKVYAVMDGGLFTAHSAAYSSPDYLGSRDVKGKAAEAINELHARGLLDPLEAGIFMTPVNPAGAPYFLCPVNKLKGEQRRHSCIEYLIGTKDLLDIITNNPQDPERFHYLSGQSTLVMERSPDAPHRPLSWSDLGLNGDRYLRLIRMLALGAATRNLIWSQDDAMIGNIPAIASILEKNGSLSEIKELGGAIANTCHGLLRQFCDYAMTGTNFEYEGTDDFVVEDSYRLMNLSAVRKILSGNTELGFAPSTIGDYHQMIGDAPPFREKRIKASNRFNSSIKALIDRIRKVSTIEEFYIRLFQTQ